MATLTAMQHMQGLQQHPIISLRQFSCRRHAVLRVAQAPSHQLSRAQVIAAAARREGGRFRDDEVYFDGEEDWQDDVTGIQTSNFLGQSLRALGIVADRLTDVALQFAPEDASPSVVRTAVSGGLILIAFSFVKGILSFILTIGTIILGAYVAVRVFGLDVSAVGEGGAGSSRNKRASKGGGSRRGGAGSAAKRASGGVAGLLGAIAGSDTEEDDGLLDVWFEKKGSKPRKSSR